MDKSEVVVIGGGVIGLAAAHELSQRGVQVTVIDRRDIGFGCSYGNAGWITPCFALPLPMPGMFLKSIGWLIDPESPLYIKPSPSFLLMGWLTRFLLSMTHRKAARSVKALTEISKYSLKAYSKLAEESDEDFAFEKKGLLMVAQTRAGLATAIEGMRLVGEHGIPGRTLKGDELMEFEPAVRGGAVGGVFYPEEAQAEPLAVVQALARAAERKGARILPRTELLDIQIQGGRINSIRTSRGVLRAEQFVLATGAWSHSLGKAIDLKIPVMGGKGYSIIADGVDPKPSRPMMIVEKKIAVTPRKDTTRIAGTLELVDEDERVTMRRVDAIVRGARAVLNLPEPLRYQEIWRGLRPCTPDGVPIMGRSKSLHNLVVATGHQMLGLQSAPASGALTCDLVLGETPRFDPKPFRVDRF